jgi:hypothetical protein
MIQMKQEVITTLDAAMGTAASLCRYAMLTNYQAEVDVCLQLQHPPDNYL